MKRANQKHADDVIVTDGEAGMRRFQEAVRHILSVPRSDIVSRPAHRKARRRKK